MEDLDQWRKDNGPTLAQDPKWRWSARAVSIAGVVAVGVAGTAAILAVYLRGPEIARPAPRATLTMPTAVPAPPEGSAADAVAPPRADDTEAEQPSRPSPAPPTSGRPIGRDDCPAPAGLLAADIDGDGCVEVLSYSQGLLKAPNARWKVGEAGDLAATGDWWCSGRADLALLRPATGEVFAFSGWAEMGTDLISEGIGPIPGAAAIRAADLDGNGCGELVVARGTLPPVLVPLRRQEPRP